MARVKQVIVVRKDLNMRKGKMIAQSCHASMKVFFDRMEYVGKNKRGLEEYSSKVSQEMKEWKDGAFTKIVVYVNSEEELDDLATLASVAGIPYALITDNGNTEFHGVPTKTALAIGPDESEAIDVITGNLPLLWGNMKDLRKRFKALYYETYGNVFGTLNEGFDKNIEELFALEEEITKEYSKINDEITELFKEQEAEMEKIKQKYDKKISVLGEKATEAFEKATVDEETNIEHEIRTTRQRKFYIKHRIK